MAVTDLIVNGGFEGGISPWVPINATITTVRTHTGLFSALLSGGVVQGAVNQQIPVTAGESYQLILSLSKWGLGTSPAMAMVLAFYDASLNYLGVGEVSYVPVDFFA